MPVRLFLSAVLFALMCGASHNAEGQTAMPTVEAGVPRELARWRAAHYRDVRYALDITLAPSAELLRGSVRIIVTLAADAGDLVLDWRVMQKGVEPRERVFAINANGKVIDDARFVSEHLVIPRAHLVAGANMIEISFASPISTSGSAVTRYLDREDNSEYVYTLLVPSDASTVFPCFDQPDLKARFKLTAEAPAQWRVISNTSAGGTLGVIGKPATSSRIVFPETEPISTYLFAFAAGPFAEFKDESSPYRTRLFVRKSKAERAKKELSEVFRLHRAALNFFESYFGHQFPFPKYDLVLVPEFAYGGMEHAGATFLREDGVLFPSDPTAADIAARAETMLHEAAHQWFGDLVTMRWFDDLWLKEGFATFMAYKAVEALMPQFDAWKVFHLRTKPLAYLTDVTKGTTPIFQEIPNLSAAKSAYGNIVYRKAPSMLRQAEFYLGRQQFQRAVQLFVKEHSYSNATWEDLVRAFERTSGKRLDAWAAAWVKRRGMADVRVRWSANRRGRINSFTVEQTDVLGEGGSWPMSVKILLMPEESSAPPETLNVTLGGAGATRVPAAIGKPRPAFVFANFEDYGYGRFLLDDASRAYVTKNLGSVKDDFLRALLWDSLWDSVREAELAPADFIALAVAEAPHEHDDVMLNFVLTRVQTAFLRYLSDAQRDAFAPQLARTLEDGMLHASTVGERITYFRTFREVATTSDALARLSDIYAGKLQVPGMTLRSRDRFDIARVLLAQGDARGESLLRDAAKQDQTDDGRRYAYATEAARPDASAKKRYFQQYLHDKDLAESWIEASLGPFNTPRQSELTLPYLDDALAELPNLKRTRKIFFVNGWLAAFIGGQCDERAADAVRDFLARSTALDRDLRLKVLEAADGLERCVRIRTRYAAEANNTARGGP
jgi:aminopeptidase N